jgi:DNA-binding MarR family transcriptional regulator
MPLRYGINIVMNVEQLIKADDICLGYGLTGIRQRKIVLAFMEANQKRLDFTDLAVRANIPKAAVSRALDVLFTLDIAKRTVNQDHHLKRWVNLTARGNQLAEQLRGK